MNGHVATELALGRYRLGGMLGRGATSSVRRALDTRTGEEVAVKTILDDPDLVARVGREIRAASRLSHPHIVPLLDWGSDPDCVRLVWELIDGPSLRALQLDGGVDEAYAVEIMADVLDALDHAHARGVVHRDVKPANILIDGHGLARLGDFGIARVSGDASLTRTGDVVGTVAYMAPEQAQGLETSASGDVYSACLVLYELLTGSNPNRASGAVASLRRTLAGEVPDLARRRPDLPRDVARLVMDGLHPVAAERPRAGELAHDLRRAATRAWPAGAAVAGAVRRHTWLPRAGRAVAAAAPTAVALPAWTGLTPAAVAAAAVAAGACFAFAPLVAVLLTLVAGLTLLGGYAPGIAVALAFPAVALALTGRRSPWLALSAAAWPLAFAAGLGPLAAAATGIAPRWTQRAGLALVGVAATITWQLLDAGHGLLLNANQAMPGIDAVAHRGNPVTAVTTVVQPLSGAPWVAAQAAVLVAAAVAAGLLGARRGSPRVMAAAAWLTAVTGGLVATAPDPRAAGAGCIASGAVLMVWTLRPWRLLGRRGVPAPSATVPTSP